MLSASRSLSVFPFSNSTIVGERHRIGKGIHGGAAGEEGGALCGGGAMGRG